MIVCKPLDLNQLFYLLFCSLKLRADSFLTLLKKFKILFKLSHLRCCFLCDSVIIKIYYLIICMDIFLKFLFFFYIFILFRLVYTKKLKEFVLILFLKYILCLIVKIMQYPIGRKGSKIAIIYPFVVYAYKLICINNKIIKYSIYISCLFII